jgi:hypothetical protein
MGLQIDKRKTKEALILTCLAVFFFKALIALVYEAKLDYGTFQKLSGLSDDRKREMLTGDLYGFILACNRIIPEKANILLLTDDAASDGLYLSYHLYPRKLFFDSFAPIRQSPPEMEQLAADWLVGKNIDWIIYRFTKEVNYSKIAQIDDGKIIQEIPY